MEILIRTYKRRLDEVNTKIHRFLYTEIDWSQPLIGIKGQRGVGKTTMMLQRIKENDPSGAKSFYANILDSHETIAASISSRINVLTLFHKYMERGYYPFYKSMKVNDYYSRLSQEATTVIESDIPAVEKKIDYETLIKAKRLLAIISASLPYIPNVSTLSGLMGTNRAQIIRLFDLLDRAGLIRQLFVSQNSPRSLAKPQKILLNNSSLMYALETP